MKIYDKVQELKGSAEDLMLRKIMDMVKVYWDMKSVKYPFRPGVDPVPTSGKIIDSKDMVCLVNAALEGWLTEGHWVSSFERRMASYVGQRSGAMVNSGSSANLLAISALMSSKLGDGRLKPGDKVVTAAAGFPTTINPIFQNGLVPIFIDVELGTYVPKLETILEGIEKGAKAVMLAHTLGNPWPIYELVMTSHEDIWIVEDNCDALGSRLEGIRTGAWGDLVTQSFYPAHQIMTGEGGMVLGKPELMKIVRSLRDWGRDCWCPTGKDNTCGKRFDWQFPNLPSGYDHKYVYSEVGYNMKSTDLQGALGSSQISKIQQFTDIRKRNFATLISLLRPIEDFFILPKAAPHSDPSWFGFPITVREDSPFDLTQIEKYLADKRIGTRRLFAGNYMKQPLFRGWIMNRGGSFLNMSLLNTRQIEVSTFWVGIWHGLGNEHMEYIAESINKFVRTL